MKAGFELLEKNLIGSSWRKDTKSGLFFFFFLLKSNSLDSQILKISRASVPAVFGVSFLVAGCLEDLEQSGDMLR